MAMDQFLAEHYGNVPPTHVEPTEKTAEDAQVELFQKLAAQNNIDLDALSEEQITHLWNATFSKEASEESGDKKDDKEKEGEFPPADDKKEEAKKEHEEKKEAMAKMAEAEFLGKVMAHSMVAELRKIAEAQETEKDAGEQPATETTEESKEAAMPPALAKALGKGKAHAEAAGKAVSGAAKRGKELLTGSKLKEHISNASSKAPGVQHLHMDEAMNEARKVTKARIGAGAAGATAVAGGAAAAAKGKKKESSALDELALLQAVKLASAEGFNVEEVDARLAAVVTLGGLGESEKIASIEDTDAAIQVRALEFLEAAGYPVTWEQG